MAEPGDLPNNGVNIIIQNKAENYLLVRHNYKDRKWSLPGGGIKRGETSKRAIIREVLEETGLIIVGRPLYFADVQLEFAWKNKVILFVATEWDGIISPRNKDEISEVRFFKPEDIKNNEEIIKAQRMLIKIFEIGYLKFSLPIQAIASDPPIIEW